MKIFTVFLFCLAMVWHPSAKAQDLTIHKNSAKAQKIAKIKALVDSQTYVFNAQTTTPMSSELRQLTPGYAMAIGPGIVSANLPYYGRAYTAPTDATDGGIEFDSKDFVYTKTPRKKGGWNIVIKPKDSKEVQQLLLTIFDTGYGNLQVLCAHREQISFTGYITGIKQSN